MSAKAEHKLFCEYGPVFYQISLFKEARKRDLRDLVARNHISRRRSGEVLPHIWKGHTSPILRPLDGVDMRLQENKATNLAIAAKRVDGAIVRPGEIFSFWNLVGDATARKGYRVGLVISGSETVEGVGGGLCQLANLIHYMVLHTPLTVVELHHHSDALFPDAGRRVPFGTGTSVAYKTLDYRFKNTTPNPVQVKVWVNDTTLCGEIRGTVPLMQKYRLVEEGNHYVEEDGVYYRLSEVYRIVHDKATGSDTKELILKNHSRVMYDYRLIPPDEILAA